MDVAGLALSVPGLISLLITTSPEGYRIVSVARSFKQGFSRLHYQLDIEHQKLKDWVSTGSHNASIELKLSEIYQKDTTRFQLIISTLLRVSQLFADVRQLESLYGIRVTTCRIQHPVGSAIR
jgi:hypothetical protein